MPPKDYSVSWGGYVRKRRNPKITFSSIGGGPSDAANGVNALTLQFMQEFRQGHRLEQLRRKTTSKQRDEEHALQHRTEASERRRSDKDHDDDGEDEDDASPVVVASAAVAHRIRTLKFLHASAQQEAQVLDLRGAGLKPEDYVSVGTLLANHPTLSVVDLREHPMTELEVRMLTTVVTTNRFITDILLDDDYLRMPSVQRLLTLLEDNREFVKAERKRRWVAAEKRLYADAVAQFVALMETLFVAEMRTRHDVEDVEWERRKEITLHKLAHRKTMLGRQKARRTIEMVLERLEILVEREAQFRREIRVEWIRGIVRACVDLETSARAAQSAEELRVRIHTKSLETKDWVCARRKEKTRKEHEASQRRAVEEEETAERQRRHADASSGLSLLLQWVEKDRDQCLAAESVRLEKERREAIQKRKEADAAREKKEREDKEHATQLLRLKIEQRKERERFETDSAVGRKRLQVERSIFFRAVETRFAVESLLIPLLEAVNRGHEQLVSHCSKEFAVRLKTNSSSVYSQLLQQEWQQHQADSGTTGTKPSAPASLSSAAATPFHTVAPHLSMRFQPPDGWTSAVATALERFRLAVAALQECAANGLSWRDDVGDVHGSLGDPDGVPGTTLGEVASSAALDAQQLGLSMVSSSLMTSVSHAMRASKRRSTGFGSAASALVSSMTRQSAEDGAMPTHSQQVAVFDWSCENVRAYRRHVESLPFYELRNIDELMSWRTNLMVATVSLESGLSAGGQPPRDLLVEISYDRHVLGVRTVRSSSATNVAATPLSARAAGELPFPDETTHAEVPSAVSAASGVPQPQVVAETENEVTVQVPLPATVALQLFSLPNARCIANVARELCLLKRRTSAPAPPTPSAAGTQSAAAAASASFAATPPPDAALDPGIFAEGGGVPEADVEGSLVTQSTFSFPAEAIVESLPSRDLNEFNASVLVRALRSLRARLVPAVSSGSVATGKEGQRRKSVTSGHLLRVTVEATIGDRTERGAVHVAGSEVIR